MWRNQLVLSCLTYFLLIQCQASSDCQMPATKDDPVSICSYCSDSHAGVRWAVHQSTILDYPKGVYSVDIQFRCNNSDDDIMDNCFDGDLFPGLTFLTNSVWRWHILEQRLPEATECHFTAYTKNGYLKKLFELRTSCTVRDDNENLIMPATCSNFSQEGCSCMCSDGFKNDEELNIPGQEFLTCLNVDECSKGTHHCSNASNCVDTEGSYYCLDEDEGETTTTTSAFTSGASDRGTSALMININKTSSLPPTTTTGTTAILYTTMHTIDYVPRMISAAIVISALLLVSIFIAVIITILILKKKLCLSKNKKMMAVSPQIADPFDPDFCPVDIDKFDSASLSTFSIKTILDPLQYSTNVDVLSTSNSIGSVIILDFCD